MLFFPQKFGVNECKKKSDSLKFRNVITFNNELIYLSLSESHFTTKSSGRAEGLLCGVCTFSLYWCGFPPGALAQNKPKTCKLGRLNTLNLCACVPALGLHEFLKVSAKEVFF